jgi:hypothetical protein
MDEGCRARVRVERDVVRMDRQDAVDADEWALAGGARCRGVCLDGGDEVGADTAMGSSVEVPPAREGRQCHGILDANSHAFTCSPRRRARYAAMRSSRYRTAARPW